MNVIEINGITKDYGNAKGVFDVSFKVKRGEVLGFLGPNGAGKTTTIRHLMGFIQPDSGNVRINGLDCFEKAHEIEKSCGYLPGEISFMDDMKGMEFINFIAGMKGMKSLERAKELISFFELNPSGRIKKMSKGMKQKIGIVCAFMQNPDILILDEPTGGLDPLMQNKFIELILQEKKKGRTILMSSHIFEEIERTCDRAVIIKEGKIVAVDSIEKLCGSKQKIFEIKFDSRDAAERFAKSFAGSSVEKNTVAVNVKGEVNGLIRSLGEYKVKDMNIRTQSLEELFMHFYGEDKTERNDEK